MHLKLTYGGFVAPIQMEYNVTEWNIGKKLWKSDFLVYLYITAELL